MARFDSPLERVRIAAPCKADWEEMVGTDRVRFCGQCNLNVYNLSSMTKSEAESFVSRNEASLCIRFYRRSDGSILTRNCPVGLRAIRRRMSYIAKAVSSTVLGFFAGLGLYEGFSRNVPLEETTGAILREANETSLPPFQVQGQIAIPPSSGMTISLGKVVASDPIAIAPKERSRVVQVNSRPRVDQINTER